MTVLNAIDGLTKNPFTVRRAEGAELLVMKCDEALPVSFALMGTTVRDKVVLRIAGGCKNMSHEDRLGMLDYYATALGGYRGLLFSGGTRNLTEFGEVDPMVTEIPGLIAMLNKECVALGTMPRTDTMRLAGELRLTLDSHGTIPNPNMDGLLVVQKGASALDRLDWNGDLPAYFGLMENWLQCGGFTAGGLVSWNGGAVTREEIVGCLSRGWPAFLVEGTARVTDEVIDEVRKGAVDGVAEKNLKHAVIVSKSDPGTLRTALIEYGFLKVA